MVQGTTPTFLFKFSVSLDLLLEWRICFAQEGKENLIKTSQDCIVDENQVIYLKLTQEETFAFDSNKFVNLRAKALTKDNNSIPSKPKFLMVDEMLDKVLFDIEDRPPTKIDTSTIDFEFDTEPCGFGLDFEDLYIEQVGTGGGNVEVDDKLSLVSTNPVQNKVVTKAINDTNEALKQHKEEYKETVNSIVGSQDKLQEDFIGIQEQIKNGKVIQSIEQSITSTEDNGINEITVTFTDGTQNTFEVRNGSQGSQGADGYTPQKGLDYFTEEDKQEMVQETIENMNVATDFANALKSNAKGKLITVNEVSPIEHKVKGLIKVDQKNLANLYWAKPRSKEEISVNGNILTVTKSDKIYGIVFPQKYLNLEVGKTYVASVGAISQKGTYCGWIPLDADGQAYSNSAVDYKNPLIFKIDIDKGFGGLYFSVSPIGLNASKDITIENIQIENGTEKTTFTPSIDLAEIQIKRYGATETDNLEIFYPNARGELEITSLSPTMTITTDNESVTEIEIEYNLDTNKVIGDISTALTELHNYAETLKGGEA